MTKELANPFELFDQILVINLDKDLYKWQLFYDQAKKYGFAHKVTRVSGCKRSVASYGCALSHKKCCDLAKTKGWNNILIFEDDAKFLYNKEYTWDCLNKALSTAEDWDLLYLGSSMRERLYPTSRVMACGDTFSSTGKWFGRFAYAVKSSVFSIYDSIPPEDKFNNNDRGDVYLERTKSIKKVMVWPQLISVQNTPSANDPFLKNCDHFIESRYKQFGMLDMAALEANVSLDFDVAIIISSYNRYLRLVSIINQIRGEDKELSYKIFILNDGSTDVRYSSLKSDHDLVILNNSRNNGKKLYWTSISTLLAATKPYRYRYLIQIDDDFRLCTHFIKTLTAMFEKNKCDAIHYHIDTSEGDSSRWNLPNWVDGGVAFTRSLIEKLNFTIDSIPACRWVRNPDLSSGVWHQVSNKIKNMGASVTKPTCTLAVHTGNFDSKMNTTLRKDEKIYSKY